MHHTHASHHHRVTAPAPAAGAPHLHTSHTSLEMQRTLVGRTPTPPRSRSRTPHRRERKPPPRNARPHAPHPCVPPPPRDRPGAGCGRPALAHVAHIVGNAAHTRRPHADAATLAIAHPTPPRAKAAPAQRTPACTTPMRPTTTA